jgi:hypothetical protein
VYYSSAWNIELKFHEVNHLKTVLDVYVLLTVQHLGIILVNNQLEAQFFLMYVYLYFLRVSSSHVPIISRNNCINTISGVCHSV